MKRTLLCSLWILGLTVIIAVVSILYTFALFSNPDFEWLIYLISVFGIGLYGLGGYFLPKKCRPQKGTWTGGVLIFWLLLYILTSYMYLWELVGLGIMDLVALITLLPMTYVGGVWLRPFYTGMGSIPSEFAVMLGAVLLVGAFYLGIWLRRKKEKV